MFVTSSAPKCCARLWRACMLRIQQTTTAGQRLRSSLPYLGASDEWSQWRNRLLPQTVVAGFCFADGGGAYRGRTRGGATALPGQRARGRGPACHRHRPRGKGSLLEQSRRRDLRLVLGGGAGAQLGGLDGPQGVAGKGGRGRFRATSGKNVVG